MYTAIAPIPLASFAGECTSQMGKQFLKKLCRSLSQRGNRDHCLYYILRLCINAANNKRPIVISTNDSIKLLP